MTLNHIIESFCALVFLSEVEGDNSTPWLPGGLLRGVEEEIQVKAENPFQCGGCVHVSIVHGCVTGSPIVDILGCFDWGTLNKTEVLAGAGSFLFFVLGWHLWI